MELKAALDVVTREMKFLRVGIEPISGAYAPALKSSIYYNLCTDIQDLFDVQSPALVITQQVLQQLIRIQYI